LPHPEEWINHTVEADGKKTNQLLPDSAFTVLDTFLDVSSEAAFLVGVGGASLLATESKQM
jgi:hypothetical protein